MTTPVIEVSGLSYTYPDGRRALDGIDLAVGAGERVALLGPNGAGKTTLALHINGILEAEAGSVRVADLLLGDETMAEIRRRVGLVFQDANDQLFMPTVAQDVAFGPANLGFNGAALEQRVQVALGAVEAEELADRAPHHLSGGERRRIAIATVLAMEPDVLVLDEPAAGFDPVGRAELIATLSKLDITQVVITHDLGLARSLCPRSVIMDGGRIVADGSTAVLLGDRGLLSRHRLEVPAPTRRSN